MANNTSRNQTSSQNRFFKELGLYLRTAVFGAITFAFCYGYLVWMKIPSELNKSLADTSILLMGMSMLLTSICYFWNFLDWSIIYRKYLGLIGFAFGLGHFLLSWGAFQSLFKVATWQQGKMWPVLMGGLALAIFSMMALISNTVATRKLGVATWKNLLRTGYVAVLFVELHVILLKSSRWVTWYQGGMKTPPSLSLLVTIFMTVVLVMRILLWWSLRRKASTKA